MSSPKDIAHQEEEAKPMLSGLAQHEESVKTPEEIRAEKRFVLKVDLMILPILIIMFFLASLDRGDVANAYTAGLQKELKMTATQLSTVLSLFYVGYLIFELPACLFLKKVTANLQLGAALIFWGTFTTLLCTTHSWQQIAGLRILIGSGEAFIQAGSLYLTFFYKRNQLATRGGIYYAMIAVAGSANGLLTYAILKNLNHVGGWLAWRWIFLIEGLMSVGFGFVVILLLPASPERLRWVFTAEEKEIALRRYREAFNIQGTGVRPAQILKVLKDPKAWFYIAIYCCTNVSLAAFSNFLPVMVRSYGFSALDTNLMTIPVWCSAGLFIFLFGITSDRTKKRGCFVIAGFVIASIGWIILLASKAKWVDFVATLFIGSGTLPTVVLIQAWMNSNMLGFTKRATTLALLVMIGQAMSIASAQVYSDAPYYIRGNSFSLTFTVLGAILTGVFVWYLARKNAAKSANQRSDEAGAKRSMNIEEIQDEHPDFFYYL